MSALSAVGVVTPADGDLTALMRENRLRSVYQPIVCLDRLAPVGVEALIRGPAGSPLESPAALFEAAKRLQRVPELDWASRRAGLLGASTGGLRGPAALFLNAEPEGLGVPLIPGFDEVAAAIADTGVQVVLEITERALTRYPAELLRSVHRVREMGWRLAIDDVGADRASLALLPFLAPDVIKLDLRLVQQRTTVEIAEIINAVLAHSERTGAAVLAEGIETEQHLELARSMGARLGQGWYFGRPGALDPTATYAPIEFLTTAPQPAPFSPWTLATATGAVRTAEKPLLVAMSKTLERHASAAGESCVILGAFQHQHFFTAATGDRYARLAQSAAYVAALATGMSDWAATNVRGSAIDPTDPLTHEWDVAVVGPHFAGALIAHEHPDQLRDPARLFDYVLTYDREKVLAVARSLLGRIAPAKQD